ncbi:hypothetical protein E2C01_096469 [Portunus trituberculatus]|uniref:Uncharacterized protein n=1 Tax=Portunus trituberculatus TaxID=210409 RepID=A0A5B7JSN0_PORTR|nr:hypothetical protein [Portunus trituberculatus]
MCQCAWCGGKTAGQAGSEVQQGGKRGLTARRTRDGTAIMAVQSVSCGTRQRVEVRRAALVLGKET